MWDAMLDRMPSMFIVMSAILSGLVPYIVYKINQMLHQYGDPPWKHEDRHDGST